MRATSDKSSDYMCRAGHDYDDPWASNNDPEWDESETATESGRRVAAADQGMLTRRRSRSGHGHGGVAYDGVQRGVRPARAGGPGPAGAPGGINEPTQLA